MTFQDNGPGTLTDVSLDRVDSNATRSEAAQSAVVAATSEAGTIKNYDHGVL